MFILLRNDVFCILSLFKMLDHCLFYFSHSGKNIAINTSLFTFRSRRVYIWWEIILFDKDHYYYHYYVKNVWGLEAIVSHHSGNTSLAACSKAIYHTVMEELAPQQK